MIRLVGEKVGGNKIERRKNTTNEVFFICLFGEKMEGKVVLQIQKLKFFLPFIFFLIQILKFSILSYFLPSNQTYH